MAVPNIYLSCEIAYDRRYPCLLFRRQYHQLPPFVTDELETFCSPSQALVVFLSAPVGRDSTNATPAVQLEMKYTTEQRNMGRLGRFRAR